MKKFILSCLVSLSLSPLAFASVVASDYTQYYKLEDVHDAVSGGGDLTNNSATFGTGFIDDGAIFTGSQNLEFPIGVALTENFTFSFWYKPTNLTDEQIIFSKYNFLIRTRNGADEGKIDATLAYDNTNASIITALSSGCTVTSGVWQFIAMTYNVSGDRKLHLYMNGVECTYDSQVASYGSFQNPTTHPFYIGAYEGYYQPISARVDEFGIANRQLNDSEILSLYNGGAGWQYPFDTPPTPSSSGINVTNIVPAYIISSQLIIDPNTASTSYNFTSTQATSTKTAGIVFVTHTATTTPTVTWGGVSMTNLIDSQEFNNYVISLYSIYNPNSAASIVVSGVASSSVLYISQSILGNASVINTTDSFINNFGSEVASVFLPSTSVPAGLFAFTYTDTDFNSFSKLTTSNQIQYATSSTKSASLLSSVCLSILDSCSVGYVHPWAFVNTDQLVIAGFSAFSTSSISTATGTVTLNNIVGILGTDAGFQSCFSGTMELTDSISCTLKNMVFWVFSLFVPQQDDIVDIKNTVISVITASSSLTSSILLLPLQLALWDSTSTIPTSSNLNIAVPLAGGGTYNAVFVGNASTSVKSTHIDVTVSQFFNWILGIFTVLYSGYLFIKFIH